MKTTLFIISISIFLVFGLSVSCTTNKEADTKKEISQEMVHYLVKINERAIANMDLESYGAAEELDSVLLNLDKLREVTLPALAWMERQREDLPQRKQEGSWRTVVTEEGLSKFKNDQYQISHLEFQLHNIGEDDQSLGYVMKVTDLTTNKENHFETVYKDLEERKVDLENRLESIEEKQLLSSWTLHSVIRLWQDWEIEQIDDVTFVISGLGLGIAGDGLSIPSPESDEKLVTGKWTYQMNTREAVPNDKQSAALKNILSGEL